MKNEEWRIKNEEWRMKNLKWRMKNEELLIFKLFCKGIQSNYGTNEI